MPAQLSMNVIANPGVDKADFELWSLAVSAINRCGACIDAHEMALHEAGVPAAAIRPPCASPPSSNRSRLHWKLV